MMDKIQFSFCCSNSFSAEENEEEKIYVFRNEVFNFRLLSLCTLMKLFMKFLSWFFLSRLHLRPSLIRFRCLFLFELTIIAIVEKDNK